MRHTNRMVLGLIAVFVLGGSLALFGCSSSDNTTEVTAQGTAANLLGGKTFTFADGTAFGVTPANTTTTVSFNATANRFAVAAPGLNRRATGVVTYGSCIFAVGSSTNPDAPLTATTNPNGGGSNFPAGTGPQPGQTLTANPCTFDGNATTVTITIGAATTTSGPSGTTPGTGGFGGG